MLDSPTDILERYLGSILEAYDGPLSWDEALRGALKAVLETTARDPAQARFVLIDALTADWKPEQYHDTYAEELRKRIKAKGAGKKTVLMRIKSEGGTRFVALPIGNA